MYAGRETVWHPNSLSFKHLIKDLLPYIQKDAKPNKKLRSIEHLAWNLGNKDYYLSSTMDFTRP